MLRLKSLGILFFLFAIAPVAAIALDEQDLEKVPYEKLLSGDNSLASSVFKGSSYPIRFFEVPRNISYEVDRSQKIVMMTDKMGHERLLLLVPNDMIPVFRDGIRTNTELNYAFKPVGIFNKYPLLQLVDLLN